MLISGLSYSQNYLLPNEVNIYSFETTSGKKMSLSKDKNDKYIIYRFGTKTKIEFEYPEKTKESWHKFTYSFYLRGGGKINEGMDLNYLAFTNLNFKYVIYYSYFAVPEKVNIGVKIIDLKTNKTVDIKGNYKTLKGNLVNFRDNKLVRVDDNGELYD
jgi:hypothetical protein